MRPSPLAPLLAGGLLLLLVSACDREDREPRPEQAATEQPDAAVTLSPLKPGAEEPVPAAPMGERYERSAWHVSEGKRLYTWFNCVGCHAHGGGGMGPALMDDKWIYGGEIQQIAATILQGRPNGMPSFRGRIPEEQV
jgi:cytochrome c oxidase cbb3-type subunit 3